jgi:cytidyltransferase-like protein
MIVSTDSLETYRKAVTMVDGGFDPLHAGHVAYFEAAAKLGLPVFCNLTGDAYVAKKHRVLLPQEARAKVIDALKPVDYVHIATESTAATLRRLQPRYYAKGKDWEGKLPAEEQAICEELGIEVVYLDTVTDSSSQRVRDFLNVGSLTEQVSGFEDFVQTQSAEGAEAYDAEYFHAEWRDESNSYRLEVRRKLEGRNPELIRDVFGAKTVVDMGCGPGNLMYLLWELGVEADGVDFAQASKDTAPEEVRERIHIGSIVDIDLPDDAYELVICREVFEHLRVLDVQKAVENLCRITSKYIYLTTRFHPAPASLFDVTTEFEVDPTHITLMNMDMLRLMFVLQGMRRRRDLEDAMDWLKKGRVLVYEKPQADA